MHYLKNISSNNEGIYQKYLSNSIVTSVEQSLRQGYVILTNMI